jgi:hypothetical protein
MGAVGSKVQRATAEIERVFSPSERNRATRRNQARENRRARWASRRKGAYNAVGRVGKFAKNIGMGIFGVGRKIYKGVARRAGNVVDYARKGTVRSYVNRNRSAKARALYKKSKLDLKRRIKEDINLSPESLSRKYNLNRKRSSSASAKSPGRSALSTASKRSSSAKKGVRWLNESTQARGSAAGVGLVNSPRSSGNRSSRARRLELFEPSPKKVNYSRSAKAPRANNVFSEV